MKKQVLKLVSFLGVVLLVAMLAPQRAAADEDDPPSRVARLAYARGNLSFNPAGTDDWVAAVVNRPITTGDKLWSDNGARAELHIGSAAIRLSGNTGFSFLNLTDQATQIRLTEGTLNIRVRRLGEDEAFEVDTPNLAFSILRPGRYRINVNESGDDTAVIVREGAGEVTGGGSAYTLHPREEGWFNGIDQLDADIEGIRGDADDFDHWCSERDRRQDHSLSSRYVSDDVIGYEDLDEYGGWRPVPGYGTVWFPHTVVVGWAPYRYGHWVWISPWGWTWVDDEPWGFAPFHYGRWVVVRGVWGWVPCPPRPVVAVAYVRPVYAPALVAWVGGAHWGIGVSVGGAPAGVAWFPLGPRDVYCPSYHVSQTYVQNVNISNTTIINTTQVTNVYNNVYVNKTVNVTNVTYQNQTAPNAVTATSHEAFTSAQSVHSNMIRVDAKEVASAPVAPLTPTVAPQQRSVLGAGSEAQVRPPAVAESRPVVAKLTPPPPPVSFVKQQQAVQANGGRPPAISQLRREQPESAKDVRSNIKIVPPFHQEIPQNTQANRPQQQPAQQQVQEHGNPNRPGPINPRGRDNRPTNVPANAVNEPSRVNKQTDVPANAVNEPNQASKQTDVPGNAVNQPSQGNKPGNAATPGNPKIYNDRPPSARPSDAGNVNPQLEQKHQPQTQDLRLKQDQDHQKIEQQQVQERQKIEQKNADAQRPPQLEQKHQQDQERQKIEQQQAQEREKQAQRNADAQRQQQIQQKQPQQVEQPERKHDQQPQKLEQKQQQERPKQEQPPKQEKPQKQDKPPKDDKPHR